MNLSPQIVLITAGSTQEMLDPVRYISNYSSGKMGYALAEAFRDQGAEVILVSGPTHLAPPHGIKFISVISALQMFEAVKMMLNQKIDIFVGTAAVCDYRCKEVKTNKIKKSNNLGELSEEIILNLVPNPDILAYVGNSQPQPYTVGFCAETEDLLINAKNKLRKKNAHLIIANLVAGPKLDASAQGFMSDENEVTLVNQDQIIKLPKMFKTDLAKKIVNIIKNIIKEEKQKYGK